MISIVKKKIFVLLCIIFTIVIISGCIARPKLRPQRNSDEIWVCKEIDNTYFYWDEELRSFIGKISYDDVSMDFVLGGSSGLGVSFINRSIIEKGKKEIEDTFMHGLADYQKNLMPVEITEDKLNILKGEVPTLTFVPQNKEDYFKKINKEDE